MAGYDIQYWFSNLWYDLTHLGTADVPSVVFRLVVVFIGFLFAKHILGVLWRVLYKETAAPIFAAMFRVVSWPFRLPVIIWRKARERRDDKRRQRQWEADQAERDRQTRIRAAAEKEAQIHMEQHATAERIRMQRFNRID